MILVDVVAMKNPGCSRTPLPDRSARAGAAVCRAPQEQTQHLLRRRLQISTFSTGSERYEHGSEQYCSDSGRTKASSQKIIDRPSQSVRSSIQAAPEPIRVSVASLRNIRANLLARCTTTAKVVVQIPLQVTFEGCDPSEAARAAIEREVERLEKHNRHIIGCRVTVIAP